MSSMSRMGRLPQCHLASLSVIPLARLQEFLFMVCDCHTTNDPWTPFTCHNMRGPPESIDDLRAGHGSKQPVHVSVTLITVTTCPDSGVYGSKGNLDPSVMFQ